MKPSDIDRLTWIVRQRLDDLLTEDDLGQAAQAVVTLDQQAVGRLSRMDALQNQAMANAQQTRRNLERRQLELTLIRIAEGEFGYCEDCGDEIAIKRLELNPAASKCINCAVG